MSSKNKAALSLLVVTGATLHSESRNFYGRGISRDLLDGDEFYCTGFRIVEFSSFSSFSLSVLYE